MFPDLTIEVTGWGMLDAAVADGNATISGETSALRAILDSAHPAPLPAASRGEGWWTSYRLT